MGAVYQRYLASHHWRSKRKKILFVRGKKCQRCGAEGYVEIHHGTYRHLGREGGDELFVLCRACHAAYHAEYGQDVTLQNTRRFMGVVVEERDPPARSARERRRYARRKKFLAENPQPPRRRRTRRKAKAFRAQEHIRW